MKRRQSRVPPTPARPADSAEMSSFGAEAIESIIEALRGQASRLSRVIESLTTMQEDDAELADRLEQRLVELRALGVR